MPLTKPNQELKRDLKEAAPFSSGQEWIYLPSPKGCSMPGMR